MKITVLIATFAAILGVADPVIQYPVRGTQYAIVVALDGIDSSQAKKMALQRAAEITVQSGGRYFTLDSEQEVQVVKSEDVPNNELFYGNMYQELIIEQDFGRAEHTGPRYSDETQVFPAYRLLFTIYTTKPWG
ncbi:MAG TPA: hypothetical protein VLE89_07425, partial [Chlamydiales bacterium]|nr:hypothetical protein [Chlamydiales bacterium]